MRSLGWLTASAAVLAGACSGGASQRIEREPLTVLRNPQRPERERSEAIDVAWTRSASSPEDRAAVRSSFKDLVWSNAVPHAMRRKIFDYLINDPDPAAAADAREMARLMLPREPSRAMVAVISEAAGSRGWKEFIPALIRSLARSVPLVPDADRSERTALLQLAPERPLVETVFAVFLDPDRGGPDESAEFRDRTRADAYDVLARLDSTGEYRRRLLEDPSIADQSDGVVALLRRSTAELRAVPISGDELRWLQRLADPRIPANAVWWTQASSALAQVAPEHVAGLRLRHAEAIRLAVRDRPELMSMSRDALLDSLRTKLASRTLVQRRNEAQGTVKAVREQLEVWESTISWADLVTVHLLDQAMRTPDFRQRLWVFLEMDREDTTTEYGGLLTSLEHVGDAQPTQSSGQPIVAWLFPPRPGQRQSDQEFVASEEMLLAGDRALAHFHFHAHRTRNQEFAGPSGGDLDYAARSGRTCIVLTSLGTDELNVDFFTPAGLVLDLGTLSPRD